LIIAKEKNLIENLNTDEIKDILSKEKIINVALESCASS